MKRKMFAIRLFDAKVPRGLAISRRCRAKSAMPMRQKVGRKKKSERETIQIFPSYYSYLVCVFRVSLIAAFFSRPSPFHCTKKDQDSLHRLQHSFARPKECNVAERRFFCSERSSFCPQREGCEAFTSQSNFLFFALR